MLNSDSKNTTLSVLQSNWGYNSLRPFQEGPVDALTKGDNIIALLPTGGGKSICFQLPALVRGGLCLVVSPLVALMEDQTHQLKISGARASALTGSLGRSGIDRVLENACLGKLDFLYLAPERLLDPMFIARSSRLDVRTIAIDEAHCISQWGHDFRREYRNIDSLKNIFPKAAWGAYTATATKEVLLDIEKQLNLENAIIFSSPTRRKNLHFEVSSWGDATNELLQEAYKLSKEFPNDAGLVYVKSRSDADRFAQRLKSMGLSAESFHAGLDSKIKQTIQRSWIKGRVQIIACTSAFGMGIDKPNVRWVLHYGSPTTLESYVQEAGRAGRDGENSKCILFQGEVELKKSERKNKEQFPDISVIKNVYQNAADQGRVALGDIPESPTEFNIEKSANTLNYNYSEIKSSLRILNNADFINVIDKKTSNLGTVMWLGGRNRILNSFVSDEDKVSGYLMRMLSSSSEITSMNPSILSRELNISLSTVKTSLTSLDAQGLIEWSPSKPELQIEWLEARRDAKKIALTPEVYSNLITDYSVKWELIQSYLYNESCRASVLDNYFEFSEETKECGVCDNCTFDSEVSKDKISSILKLRKEQGIDAFELIRLFHPGHRCRISTLLRELYDAGKIHTQDTRVFSSFAK